MMMVTFEKEEVSVSSRSLEHSSILMRVQRRTFTHTAASAASSVGQKATGKGI